MSYHLQRFIDGYADKVEREEAKKKRTQGTSAFIREIQHRINGNMDSRIIVEGEAGLGKSYASLRLGEIIDPKHFVDDPDEAVASQVLFSASEFLGAVQKLPPFSVIIYDEPGQSFHHREFMSQANIILSKMMIGYRFKRFITFLNIPSLGMIDKDAKTLVSFLINVTAHGQCEVFKQSPSKFGGDPWFHTVLDSYFLQMPGVRLRHVYEKKKQTVQDELYAKYGKLLANKEEEKLSTSDMVNLIRSNPSKYQKDGAYNVSALMSELDIGRDRATALRHKLNSTGP